MENRIAGRPVSRALVLLALVLVSACTYGGGTDPVTRKFTWFSYVAGDDLRAACRPGLRDRYRFVHNAVYVEQVRTYEVRPALGPGHVLEARVFGPPDLSRVVVEGVVDLAEPWRGVIVETPLAPESMERLRGALAEAGVFGPAPVGLELWSDGFYWTVAACVDGGFRFNAYQWPSDRFKGAAFAPLLFRWDATGVAVNPPRRTDNFDIYGEARPPDRAFQFKLRVGENGIAGPRPLF
jgi:hypothetical protein